MRVFLSDGLVNDNGVDMGNLALTIIVMGHDYGTDYWGYPFLGILAMMVLIN